MGDNDSLLANYRFSVVTGYVIEAWRPLDDDCQTVLIPLCIIWLARAPSRQFIMHHSRFNAHPHLTDVVRLSGRWAS